MRFANPGGLFYLVRSRIEEADQATAGQTLRPIRLKSPAVPCPKLSSSPKNPASPLISPGRWAASSARTTSFENDQYVISSAIGHLVELALPSDMDKKRGKWTFAALPVIPEEFDLKPIEKNEDRFKMLKRLMKRADVTEIINACDAGREGELIFRLLVKLAGVKKPMRRLWLQSMTPDAIRHGLRAAAFRRGDDPAGKGGVLPGGKRLARGDQRHAGDDGLQFQGGRLPTHAGRPGADAHAGDPGRAGEENPGVQAAHVFRGVRRIRGEGRQLRRALDRRKFPQRGG